jgi:NADH-quinone oxidoreductase subunit G
MPKITVNDREYEAEDGLTIMQFCQSVGIEIPHFCYHEKLKIAGSCRMCLVEVENMPKLVASCAIPVAEGMVIHTNNDRVKEARKSVMELLLINHPLDCPICDQGGECDLQDIAVAYGMDKGRYCEDKRAVGKKNFGSLIKANMTRCIHCTRCIRFLKDVAGTGELGGLFRGENLEISSFDDKPISSELSGNLIDICPVGALTSKPFAFKARPWELKTTTSIDVSDAMGSNTCINTRDGEVLRIIPSVNDGINENWISDKARFSYDGIVNNRIDTPYVRDKGVLKAVSWEDALSFVAEGMKACKPSEIAVLTSGDADCETMMAVKDLMEKLGCDNIDCRPKDMEIDASKHCSYLFNSTFEGVEKADALLIVGADIRKEASVLNSRIRKRFADGRYPVALVGQKTDMTFDYEFLGENSGVLEDILSEKCSFSKVLKKAKNPLIIMSSNIFCREDGFFIANLLRKISNKFSVVNDEWNGFSVLHNKPNLVGGLFLNFVPKNLGLDRAKILSAAKNDDIKMLYLLNDDDFDAESLEEPFVVYQGTHFSKITEKANIILPSVTFAEKQAYYVNNEGRIQTTRVATFPIHDAKEDWKIVRKLSEYVGEKLPYDTLKELRQRFIKYLQEHEIEGLFPKFKWCKFGLNGEIYDKAFENAVDDYFATDAIVRNSKVLLNHKIELEESEEG